MGRDRRLSQHMTHNYLGIDLDAIWSVIETDLPQLKAAIERMSRTLASTEDRS